MGNVLIARTNRADTGTLSAGSYNASFPLVNLQDLNVDKPARSSSAASANTRFKLDLGSARSLRTLVLAMHNLQSTATWRVRGSTSVIDFPDVGTFPYDSGNIPALQMTFQGDTPSDWGSRYNLMLAFAAVSIRYLLVEIFDTTNPAGYVELGRLFVGTGLQPAVNPTTLQEGRKAFDTVTFSASGKKYGIANNRPRWTRISLDVLTQSEADYLHELQDEVGVTGEVVYVPDPDDMPYSQRYGFLGNMRELTAIEYPMYETRGTAFQIDQKL